MKEIKIFEFFSGIGSQMKALKNLEKSLNFITKSVGACDFYIDAIVSYMCIHHGNLEPENDFTKEEMISILNKFKFSNNSKDIVGENYFKKINEQKLRKLFPYLFAFVNNDYFNKKYDKNILQYERLNATDIRDFDTLPDSIDILTYSFPCQDLSQQGKQKGIEKNTRSGLLYEIERILKLNLNNLPKVLILENVKALVSKKFINQFNAWINALSELGYKSSWKIINASDFGSAQNRERVFMVSVLSNENFEFPKIDENNSKNVSDIWEYNGEHKIIQLDSNQKMNDFKMTKNKIQKAFINNYSNFNSENYIYSINSKGATLTASGANSRLKFWVNNEIQIMNSLEALLYMGFESDDYEKIKNSNLLNENKIIFTAGNSISVEVLENLFKKIIKEVITNEQ
ncbi:DNA (cytosine-5-)-methyltransferase N-terminal subunit [Mycoplasmopsis canis]|uniref:DNA (cytosine-5-)-methyltransferase N-terminal subunit n=1 Tax=Mycoplasmopsis canis TaxID=29555 RepID=UPI0009BAEF4B|nr:DNA (cytosine-5-)-methyltransferase [Mycoplasmopsis canis]